METFAQINKGKAAGPSGVTLELLNVCEKEWVKRLAEVVSNMPEKNKMPECRRKSDQIPTFEGKDYVRSC